ncbi:MAG: phosphatase PAP2 family protein [Mycobacterium sp.]
MALRKAWIVGLAAAALAVYALMWIGYAMHWHWLDAIDTFVLDGLHRYGVAHPGWVTFWDVFCTVAGPAAFRLLAVVLIVIALVHRNLRAALFLVITVELGGLLTEVAKSAANRPRPPEALVYAWSTSFPSGHAIGVMIGVLALLTVVLPIVRRPLRGWLIALGAIVVVAIGIGRVVLNVHYVSDVVAGWALGYLYFAVCLLVLAPPRLTSPDKTPEAPDSAR